MTDANYPKLRARLVEIDEQLNEAIKDIEENCTCNLDEGTWCSACRNHAHLSMEFLELEAHLNKKEGGSMWELKTVHYMRENVRRSLKELSNMVRIPVFDMETRVHFLEEMRRISLSVGIDPSVLEVELPWEEIEKAYDTFWSGWIAGQLQAIKDKVKSIEDHYRRRQIKLISMAKDKDLFKH